MAAGNTIHPDDVPILRELLAWWRSEGNRRDDTRPPEPRQPRTRPRGVGLFLESLPSGGSADVAVLTPQRSNEVQTVEIRGLAASTDTFRLRYDGQTTGDLPLSSSAATVRAALEALSTIGPGNVRVDFGGDVTLRRWFVTFVGSLARTDVPLLEVTNTAFTAAAASVVGNVLFEDSGETEEIHAAIPLPTPTPVVAGAVGGFAWLHGLGYMLTECECRNFDTTTPPGY